MSESLRDQLSAAYDKVTDTPSEPVAPTGEVADTTPASASTEATAAPATEVKTDDRPRDEQGRFLPKDSAKPEVQAQVEPAKPRPQRPSSWKKDYWDHWEKLDPSVAEYINQREGEYAKGVSTYKSEYDRAKPLLDAVAPYTEMFRQYGVDPAQQFTKYAEIHKSLALGSPEQKLSTFLRIAQDYQIPVQNLFVQGGDGKIYFNPQVQQPAQREQQAPDLDKLVAQKLDERLTQQEIAAMAKDTKTYPHFETVRQTMSGLLQSGLAQDLPTAYQAALRLPQHSEIWEALQQQERETKEKEKAEQAKKQLEAAKRNAVSPKTSTPAGTSGGAKKGLRATLEDAFETHTASRV